uniref:GntR family transcriptional regulator n=1 Tax=Streptomyces sp. NBC_00003 TaxID=2903608 RepID=A0AAU2UVW4_9ACTN
MKAEAVPVPVAGSIVPRWRQGATAEALAPDYRRIVELLEGELPDGGEGLMARELTARLGLELVPAKIEGVRSKARRLVERGWLAASPSGRFMPRARSVPDAAS